MKKISILALAFTAHWAFASDTRMPAEYYTQKADIIFVGKIEKMEYGLQGDPPHEDWYYNLAYMKVDEVLKGDVDRDEEGYMRLRMASKKNGEISAITYWNTGAEGIWFLAQTEWGLSQFGLSPIEEKERVKREISYQYKRRFGKTAYKSYYGLNPLDLTEWPDERSTKLDEIPLILLVMRLNQNNFNMPDGISFTLDGDLDPYLGIKTKKFEGGVLETVRNICDQHEELDFEFGDRMIIFFDRNKAEQDD